MTATLERRPPAPDRAVADAPVEVTALLGGARRRMRGAAVIDAVQRRGPWIFGAALMLVLIGRAAPWGWPEPVAAAIAIGGSMLVVFAALRTPITLHDAAVTADRTLTTHDAFTACLEFGADAPTFGEPLTARARELARGHRCRDAVVLSWSVPRLILVAAFALVAVGAALAPNPQDDVRQQQAEETAAVERAAADIRHRAEELRSRPDATDAERKVADELDALARDLEQATSRVEARQLLSEAEAALQRAAPDAAMKAATSGLERSLGQQPLTPRAEGDAAAQLDAARQAVASMSASERAQLADRLDALARTQSAGNPALADDMQRAADALRTGDVQRATDALGDASRAQRTANASVRDGDVRASAAAAVRESGTRLDASVTGAMSPDDARPPGTGAGQGTGQGQGKGQGQGQGQGQGDGQGQGEGDGQGQGRSPAGRGQGGGAGTEGPGSPGFEVYAPPSAATDQMRADGSGTGDPGREVGRSTGANRQSDPRQDLRTLPLDDYRDQATAAAERAAIPPSQRELVKNYFDQLDANLGSAP